jgi:hypothetical protein
MKKPVLNSGLRGTKYFIEFPITDKYIDTSSILNSVKEILNTTYGVKMTTNDTFSQEDMVSHIIDYDAPSSTAKGEINKGSLYLRGVKGTEFDSYKFIIEKNVDFHDIDIKLILTVCEEAFKYSLNPVGIFNVAEDTDP